jgi:CHAT domain-containing protein
VTGYTCGWYGMSSRKLQALRIWIAVVLSSAAVAPTAVAETTECGITSAVDVNQGSEERDSKSRDRLIAFESARAAVESDSADADVQIERARPLVPVPGTPSALDIRIRIHFARTLVLRSDRLRSGNASERIRAAALDLEASGLLDQAADHASLLELHRIRSFALGYRAEIYERSNRLDDALLLNRSALAAAYAVSDPEALARWHAQRGHLFRESGRPTEARTALEHARTALERLRFTVDVAEFVDLARPILMPLTDLLLREAESNPTKSQSLLAEVQRVLEGLKTAELRDFFGDPCLADQVRTDPSSIPGTLVLYPVVLEDRVELLVARAGRLHRFRSTATGEELVEEVRRFTIRLQDPTTRRYAASSEQLYDWLVRPIESFLDDEIEALVVVPSGPLLQLPIAALRDSKMGRFLIERVPVAVTPSLELTEPRPIDRNHTQTLVAGLTTSVEDFAPLPNAHREMIAVEESFPGEILENERFTLARFESTFDSRPFGIVHIASHGSFSGRSEDSFLLAHDSRIPIDRLAEIIGRSRFRSEKPLELLTLSACESAVGDDRAMLGLAGIAVRSGARSALATLWSVNDDATADLIARFYRELSQHGVSRARALQRAQTTLLSSERFRHPSFWAPFIIINSWL